MSVDEALPNSARRDDLPGLLFLVHRIPYPPDKGDKIRSYHELLYLSKRYRVYLATFIDTPEDDRHRDALADLCYESLFVRLEPRWAKLRSAIGLLTGTPLTLPYYHSPPLQRWVRERLESGAISKILVFSSAMAQFVVDAPASIRKVIDFVDVDSDKWCQYAESKSWPLSAIYRRECRQLFRYERDYAADFDASLFVSAAEAELFRERCPESHERVHGVANGVDTERFSPEHTFANPYGNDTEILVFTGAMDYWANEEGALWFAEQIFPLIRASRPNAQFYIVGRNPSRRLEELANQPGIHVTGTVPDVRPYLAHARVAVAPLRIARGVQNKVLEAMAMALPVLATPQAIEGIDPPPCSQDWVQSEPAAMAERAVALLVTTQSDCARTGRKWVQERYGWQRHMGRLIDHLEGAPR